MNQIIDMLQVGIALLLAVAPAPFSRANLMVSKGFAHSLTPQFHQAP
jgi:hypothetical protein